MEIPEQRISAGVIAAAKEMAIAALTATTTEIMEGTIGTLTVVIVRRPTTTRSFTRRATIRIMMTAKVLTTLATTMVCSPARTMAGGGKPTIRNARTFTTTRNEGIVPAKECGTLISRLTVTAFCTAIVKGTNIGRIISSAGSSDRDAEQSL